MRFKAIFLTAASLLTLAGATANFHALDSLTARDPGPTVDATLTSDVSNVKTDSIPVERVDLCNANCHAPWLKCVEACGGTQFCKNRCNCQLFNNPRTLCRMRKCVQPPQGCSPPKRNVVEERQVNNPCVPCQAAINVCIRECGGGEGCELSCKCNLKNSNPLCNECNIQCGTNPNQLVSRDDKHIEDEISPELAKIFPPMGPWPALGPAPVPCSLCIYAINVCKTQCYKPGACDDMCNCFHKTGNGNCQSCKFNISCHCNHACPRLAPMQRRTALDLIGGDIQDTVDKTSNDLVARDDNHFEHESSSDSAGVAIPPPSNPCVECQFAINSCTKKCVNPGACNDACNCYHGGKRKCQECDIPCHCGHTCPRLAAMQRRVGVDLIDDDVQDTINETSVELGSAGVPNPCVVCATGIKSCKNKCNGNHDCEASCDCDFKKRLQCKECKDINCPGREA